MNINTMPPQIQNSSMTPSAVEVLLHYHMSPEPHPRHDAPAVKSARETFFRLGVIEPVCYVNSRQTPATFQPNHKLFGTTERGHAWVEAICNTTCPI